MMAPSEAAKNLQGNRARPRTIVPAIPLPYIQKRKLATPPRRKENETTSITGVQSTTTTPASPPTKVEAGSSIAVNGVCKEQAESKKDAVYRAASPLTLVVEEKQGLTFPVAEIRLPDVEVQTGQGITSDVHGPQGEPNVKSCLRLIPP